VARPTRRGRTVRALDEQRMKTSLSATMRALTVRQPWAWAIIHAGKGVDNRSTKHPRWWSRARRCYRRDGLRQPVHLVPDARDLRAEGFLSLRVRVVTAEHVERPLAQAASLSNGCLTEAAETTWKKIEHQVIGCQLSARCD
jgi:hypothetical protein